MRDVVKARYPARQPVSAPPPRRRRRKRNYSLYYLMIFILVAAAGITLSLTVFFKVTKINVEGTTQYDTNSIIEYSKIRVGDNIFRADYEQAITGILQNLIYIDNVQIKKTLTCEVDIFVEPSVPKANILYDGGYLLISGNGKVLEKMSEPKEGLRIIKGYAPEETEIGDKLISLEEGKSVLADTLLDLLDKLELAEVTQVDITDKYNLILSYENRITIELGGATDLEYKINYAAELISTQISATKEGTLLMLGGNEASFLEKGDLEEYRENYQTATAQTSSGTSSSVSQSEVSTAAPIQNGTE